MASQNVCDNYKRVLAGVAASCAKVGRDPHDVTLIAVSKGHPAEKLAALARGCGQNVLVYGESYAQEALPKQKDVMDMVRGLPGIPALDWHFIGHIQSRKAKEVAGHFSLLHSIDSLKLAKSLDKAWHENVQGGFSGLQDAPPSPQRILLQVNIGREPQKSGVCPGEAEDLCLAVRALPGLSVEGLMCLPPVCGEQEQARPFFAALAKLRETLRRNTGLPLPHLSMGMSGDYPVAVEEGATIVRVGTDIFGEREKK